MITGVGIGFVGFGLILVYAAMTGQNVKSELAAIFTGTYTPPGKSGGVKMAPGVTPAQIAAAATGTNSDFQNLFPAPAPGTFSTPPPKASNPLPRPPAPGGTRSGQQP